MFEKYKWILIDYFILNSECSTKSTDSSGEVTGDGKELINTKSPSHPPSTGQLFVTQTIPTADPMPNFNQFYAQFPGMGPYSMGMWPFNQCPKPSK